MRLERLREYAERHDIRLSSSEELELRGAEHENPLYNALRELGYYRVFDTYYKDEYDCIQDYCTGYINSEGGYDWLIALSEEEEDTDLSAEEIVERLDTIKWDLYVVTKGNTRWDRQEQKVYTGTAQEVLQYGLENDLHAYSDIAYTREEKEELMRKRIAEL